MHDRWKETDHFPPIAEHMPQSPSPTPRPPAPAFQRAFTDVIWEPLLKGKFDRYYDKVTMAWLWGRVKQRVESRDRGDTTEKLGYFDGGFASLVDELVGQATSQGATFHTSSPVEAIERLESGKVKVTSAAVVGEFDAVLMTTPSTVAAKLLAPFRSADPAYFEKLEAID